MLGFAPLLHETHLAKLASMDALVIVCRLPSWPPCMDLKAKQFTWRAAVSAPRSKIEPARAQNPRYWNTLQTTCTKVLSAAVVGNWFQANGGACPTLYSPAATHPRAFSTGKLHRVCETGSGRQVDVALTCSRLKVAPNGLGGQDVTGAAQVPL